MSDSHLMAYVHEDMVYRRVPLPEGENGLALLRAANVAIVNDDDEIGHVYYADSDGDCECGQADCLTCNYDYAKVMSMLVNVLEKNARSLELYSQVLAKGRLQFPTPCRGPWFGGSESDHNYALDQLKTLETRGARERGDLAAAARLVVERAKMAGIVGRGEGPLTTYITAIGSLRAALRGALALVEMPAMTLEALDELAKIEAFVLDEDALAQATRAAFLITLDTIAGMDREWSLPEQIDRLLADFYLARPIGLEGEPWDDEGRLDERRRQMHVVLDGHPRAWDAAETVRRLSAQAARQVPLDWQESETEEDGNHSLWQHLPPQLQPYFSIEWFGNSPNAAAAREEARGYGAEIPDEASSDADLAAARRAIRALDNPLGLLVANALQPTDIRDLCRECQALAETLAERIRERRERL